MSRVPESPRPEGAPERTIGDVGRNIKRGAQRLVNSIRETRRSSANAAGVISSAVQFARDYLECVRGPGIDVSQDIEPDFQLPGDPAAWERVLVNLLVNAAEAGAKHVQLQAGRDEVVVRDDGHGISPDLLPHIFQPHVSTKTVLSGLGLYVVQSIVEQHGGTVTASNLHGGGAEFRMRLSPVPEAQAVSPASSSCGH